MVRCLVGERFDGSLDAGLLHHSAVAIAAVLAARYSDPRLFRGCVTQTLDAIHGGANILPLRYSSAWRRP
jgi:hypothetical protein